MKGGPLDLEFQAWEALTTSGEAAADFYGEVLAEEVLMLFPGGMVMDDRSAVIESMTGSPWQSFDITDERVLPLGETAAVVAYRATAVREGVDYTALFSSTYLLQDDVWKLAFHQQTPV
jgi:hypothetical protein